ncbi:inorganic phosphate transporter [Georgenia ruanii]|uniref:Inorganic phosphate transporter n=1 Tax=Georgenia ruanii TaxID=348442 RepID=A0A7J9UV77_9MICO|nr:inorganic phosphate transporter [Georgenia ruanii]MPV88422.1 inorganic phosphate transporter [Georgenia ruanii]
MDLVVALVVVVVAVALFFDFTNGFHDAANAIATSVSTRALTPRLAVAMAAAMNLLGALLGTGVAQTIGSGIISPPSGVAGLAVVLAGLGGAIAWNLLTWWFGLPSSSTYALIGGLAGAGIAAGTTVHWDVLAGLVALPMVLSLVLGLVLGYVGMVGVLWAVHRRAFAPTMRRFRMAQSVSAAAMALGHGLQDAQKTMGVITLALVAGGLHQGPSIPLWVTIVAAIAIAAGTYAGGWRIMRTLGRRVIELDPARGFVAESVAASLLYGAAYLFHAPVSTTQTITAAIMGVGATRRLSAVRWGVAGKIGVAWVLTIPGAGLTAAALAALFGLLGA